MASRTAVAASEPNQPARRPAKKTTPSVRGRVQRNAQAAPSALSTHQVQAAVEGVADVEDDKVEFMGEYFRVADKIGLMPMLKFAHVANQGIDSADMEGLAALYAMIRECIDPVRPQKQDVDERTGEPKVDAAGEPLMTDAGPSEWDRFERHAMDSRAEDTDLIPVVQRAMEIIAARPTRQSSGSSAGRRSISGNSKASSPQTAMRRPAEIESLMSVDSLLDP